MKNKSRYDNLPSNTFDASAEFPIQAPIKKKKKKYGQDPLVPFQSNLFEDVKVSNDYEGQSNAIIDSSIKGYIPPDASCDSSENFEPIKAKQRLLQMKAQEISSKRIPQNKLPSIVNARMVDHKTMQMYIREKAKRDAMNDEPSKGSILNKVSVDASRSNVLMDSIINKMQMLESSKVIIGASGVNNNYYKSYEESIDMTRKDGWRGDRSKNINDSFAYGVSESIYKPHKLDESNSIFTLNMNKNYKNRVRKVDIERQQEELKKAQEMQGQGDTVIKGEQNNQNNENDSIAVFNNNDKDEEIPKLKVENEENIPVTHSSGEKVDVSRTQLRMKRRRSRTNDFMSSQSNNVTYGNYMGEGSFAEVEGTESPVKFPSKAKAEEQKSKHSPGISKRELPLSAQERLDIDKYNYSSYTPNSHNDKSKEDHKSASKSPLKSNYYFSQYDKITESKINSQEDQNEIGIKKNVMPSIESGSVQGYSRKKKVLNRDMKNNRNKDSSD